MLLARILASLIDLFVGIFSILIAFIFILPHLSKYINHAVLLAVLGIGFCVVFNIAVQYPFLKNHQTLGKGFFSLKVITTDQNRPLTIGIIVQREILCKWLSCCFICIPVLFHKAGGHEEATRTAVRRETGKGKKRHA